MKKKGCIEQRVAHQAAPASTSQRGPLTWWLALLAGVTLTGSLFLAGCTNPGSNLDPKISLKQGSTSYASGSEYVFHQGVVTDGDGGICSGDVVFTVENEGGSDLLISGIALSSGNTTDFESSVPAQTTVKPGFSTTFTICLDPVAWATETAVVATITSNDEDNGTYTLSLKGFGMRSRLTASDGVTYDEMGYSVALSGDTAVVGTDGANAAYVFYRNQGGADNWGLVKKLTGSGRFGHSVAVSGDIIVVGSPDAGNQEGGITVFYRDWGGAGNWGEVKYCVANDQDGWDNWFGSSLALSGDVLVVGARRDTMGSFGCAGSAYVCYRNQGTSDNWGIVKKLLASDRAGNDYFGTSLSLSADTVVVGAPGHRYTQMGAAYVFDQNQGGLDNWGQSKELLASDGEDGDRFGQSVAIDGDTLVVGADMENAWQGSVYMFYRDQGGTGNWGEVKKIPNSNGSGGDRFGASAVITGDTIVVGAPGQSGTLDWDGGSIVTFSRNQGGVENWGQARRIAAAGVVSSAGFGSALALSGGLLLVGAPFDSIGANTYQGSAFVCEP
jgi:hypothetical protein